MQVIYYVSKNIKKFLAFEKREEREKREMPKTCIAKT